MFYIIFAILMFGVLIFVHEGGHFLAARLLGVQVNEFSIGMGPVLWKKQGKETLYSIRIFPIGGFCAMEGENEVTGSPRAFLAQKAWKRLIILAAGAFMNFLTGLMILIFLYSGSSWYGTTELSGLLEGCPSADYFQEGDVILSVNGSRLLLYDEFTTVLSRGNGETADFVILRDGEKIKLTDVPCYLYVYTYEDGTSYNLYGFQFTLRQHTVLTRITTAFYRSLNFVRLVWWSLEDMLGGSVGVQDLSGPIGIVSTMSEVGESSASWTDAILNLLYFAAFIAVNLAVMNLLPLPALDGGRIFFLLVNAILWVIARKRIPDRYESIVHAIGLVLLLGLMIVVAAQDIFKIFVS